MSRLAKSFIPPPESTVVVLVTLNLRVSSFDGRLECFEGLLSVETDARLSKDSEK